MAPFFGADLVASAYRLPQEVDADGAAGVLGLGTAFAVLGTALATMSEAAKSLVLERRYEALRSFPALRGLLAVHHMALACVGWSGAFMVGAFVLFYAPTTLALGPTSWALFPFVVLTAAALSVTAGFYAYQLTVRWIDVRPTSVRGVHYGTGVVALIVFALIPVAPKGLFRSWPDEVAALGAMLRPTGAGHLFQLVLVGLGTIVLTRYLRARVLEAATSPSPVIWNGPALLLENRFSSSFSGLVRSSRRGRLWRLFWAKDVMLPALRRPGAILVEFLTTLGFVGTGGALAMVAHQRMPASAATLSQMSLLAFSLIALAAISLYRGVGCLGVETPMLPVLKSAIGFRGLWRHKLLSSAIALVPHLLFVAVGLLLAAVVRRDTTTLGQQVCFLGAAAVCFPLTAVGVGFLFPRLDPVQGGLFAGSTHSGRVLAIVLMLYFVGVAVAAHWMSQTDLLPGQMIPAVAVVTAGGLSALALLFAALGVRRMNRMEL